MRIEEDFIGKVSVPKRAYYGSFTARASNNFRLSGTKVHPELIRSVALIKKCAALANSELGTLAPKLAVAIVKASDEVIGGKLDSEFILDAFQAGAGTPLHMNVNEVIANRAEEMLGGKIGQYKLVHPNNHVNMSQSSNNVVPSAIKIAAMRLCSRTVSEGMKLRKSFDALAGSYKGVMKIGRTHLQDAVPMTYGQAFAAYSRAIEKDVAEIERAAAGIREIGVGGTAIGSGILAHPKFREKVAELIRKHGKVEVVAAKDCIEITQDMNDFLPVSGALRRYAITLGRISNDLRLLASGPKGGIAEIILPEVEPGSSIMPGKINPSIPEAVNMACFQAIADDSAVMLAAQSGQLELNFATPLIAYSLFQEAELLGAATAMLREHCVEGLRVDDARARENFERTFGYATALNPYLGYKEVSLLVKEAYGKGVSLRELVLQKGIMGKEDLDAVISSATGPAIVDKGILGRVRKP
ncbi:aspartate ammonia-lyase [Candidatus Micrarchaeota archaeon]|nr:aspartate ammonia-lyase [Candidatus Micrarchaeota archaeon]